MLKKCRNSFANTLTTCTTHVSFTFGLRYIVGKYHIYSKVVHFYNITRGCYFFSGHKNIPVSKYLHPLRYGE